MSDIPRTITEEWKQRRREVLIRDDYTCQECGSQGGPQGDVRLEVHHTEPKSKGGSDNKENLQTLCRPCHQSNHDRCLKT